MANNLEKLGNMERKEKKGKKGYKESFIPHQTIQIIIFQDQFKDKTSQAVTLSRAENYQNWKNICGCI